MNPKLKQDQIAKDLVMASSTLQRYRQDINMLSPYRIPPNSHNRRQGISNTKLDDNEHDLQRPQMTSKDTNENVKPPKSKNKTSVKGGSLLKNIEINEKHLDEIPHTFNLYMELAMQIISNDKTVRSDTVQDLKEFNSQSRATQAKKEKN